jgi:carbon-monoxide dehydrogenase medium subunit
VKPAPFDYHAPTSVAEAVDLLASLDDAKVIAGGQSLVPILALRLARFDNLVDLGRVDQLRGIERTNGTLTIGAMTTQTEIGSSTEVADSVPLLAKATPLIGHFQIRNRGTLGGSIAHADPSAEYPSVAVALDAEMEVASAAATRQVPASSFFESTFTTSLNEDELLVAVRFPVWGAGSGFAVEEMARRHGDFALVGVMAGVSLAGGRITKAALSLFGVGGTPYRATAAEAALVGADPATADLTEIGRMATSELEPPDDIHASGGYRKSVGAVLVSRALARAIEEATNNG